MKILWITEFFPESSKAETTGGVETRCFFVNRYLQERGHDIKIIARPTSGSVWKTASFSSIPRRVWFTLGALVRGLAGTFDVVEGTNFTTYPVAWLVGTLKRKPVVFWYPDVFLGLWINAIGLVGVIGELAEWVILRLPVSRYIAISNSTKNKLIKAGVPAEKIDVIYCGIDPKEAKNVGGSKKKFDVCVVSRLVSYKKVDDLIRVIPADLKVAVVGQGPQLGRLKKLSAGKRVKFFGYLPSRKKVLKIMASSKIFCLPSAVEGFGIVVIEAAAVGVPYVARNIPAISEVTKNGLGGLLFSRNKDIAPAIDTLLANRRLYQRKTREAKKLAAGYQWDDIARQTTDVYEKVLAA